MSMYFALPISKLYMQETNLISITFIYIWAVNNTIYYWGVIKEKSEGEVFYFCKKNFSVYRSETQCDVEEVKEAGLVFPL